MQTIIILSNSQVQVQLQTSRLQICTIYLNINTKYIIDYGNYS